MKIKETNNLTFGIKYKLIPKKDITARVENKVPLVQIAAEYNVPLHVVTRSIEYAFLRSNEQHREKICELHKKKYKPGEIKNLLNCSIRYIKSVIRQLEAAEAAKAETKAIRTKIATNEKAQEINLVHSIMQNFKIDSSVLKDLK